MNLINKLRLKLFFTILLGLLTFTQVSARCRGAGLSVFPKNGVIKPNSLFIISGYATSQNVITSLNKDLPIYLEGDGHMVKLKIVVLEKGRFSTTQAILQPSEDLIDGQTYSLRIDGLDEYQKRILYEYYLKTYGVEKISWTVEGTADTLAPLDLAAPKFIDKSASYFGCGSAAYANFKITAQDQSSLLVETELVEIASGKSHAFHLHLGADGIVSVGHGMCGGVFDFTVTGVYKVRFRLMDICGNKNDSWSAWTEFKSPFEEVGERPY
jgi:hypothetical protein